MRRRHGLRFAAALAVALLAGCASSPRATAPATDGWREEGLASWYGHPYHGRATASGERYDMNQMTAAHRTLPFGTVVRVTNLDNGREADVTINDRGPFVPGRILDLSRAAAEALDAIGPGVVRVRCRLLRPGDGMKQAGCWEVQVGAFGDADNVRRARNRLEEAGLTVRLAPASGGLTRVRVTGFGSRDAADQAAARLSRDYPGATPVPCGGGV